jgi:hypothetical protein
MYMRCEWKTGLSFIGLTVRFAIMVKVHVQTIIQKGTIGTAPSQILRRRGRWRKKQSASGCGNASSVSLRGFERIKA